MTTKLSAITPIDEEKQEKVRILKLKKCFIKLKILPISIEIINKNAKVSII